MASNITSEKVLDLDTIWKEPKLSFKVWPRRSIDSLKWLLGISDIILAFLAFLSATSLFGYFKISNYSYNHWISMILYALLAIIFIPSQQLYSRHLVFSKRKQMAHLAKAFASSLISFSFIIVAYAIPIVSRHYSIVLLILIFTILIATSRFVRFETGVAFYMFKVFGISMLGVGALGILGGGNSPKILLEPIVIIVGFIITMVSIFAARLCFVHLFFDSSLRRYFRRQIAVIGSDDQGYQIVSYIIDRNAPFWVAGTIGEKCQLKTKVPKSSLGAIKALPGIVNDYKIDEMIVTDQHLDKRTLICILDYCLSHGIHVWFPPSYLEIIDRKLYIDNFCGLPMIKLCSPNRIWMVNKAKHALDAFISFPLFFILLPLFGMIAAAIKMTSPGPVFYRAKAIGKMGREFTMYKFRSMRVNNDAQIHKNYVTKLIKGEIGKDSANDGKPLKIVDDPRITSVGHFLRKLSLDELPQLINVIKGDMSLVGPRPCLPYEYEIYQDWYKKRSSIRPGISGLWQVAGRSEVAFEDMILLDLYYVYNRSLWMDLNILIETVFVIIEKRGAH